MKTAPWIIIIVLLVVVFLQRKCSHVPDCPPCPECTLPHCDTTLGDTIVYPDTVYMPIPDTVFVDTGSVKYIFHDIDTNAIINDYMLKLFYPDTIKNDTNLFVAIYDTVFGNRIISRRPVIRFKPTIITKTTTVIKKAEPVRKLFAGVGIGRNPDQFGLSANLMYISKKDNAYAIAYDVLQQDIYFTMYWKIKLKNGR